jgi:sigma-E factor negative regulatory protein RseA
MMNDEIREQLSALADDELTELERPLLLGRMQRDRTLRECLGRYQLIGEIMRGAGASAGMGIAQRVQDALADDAPVMASEPAAQSQDKSRSVQASEHSAQDHWWKPMAGLAVAASVALVAVLAVTNEQSNDAGASVAAVTATVPKAMLASSNDESRWDRIEPQVEKRLAGFLVNHSEYAASRGVQGVMPYARVVSDTHQ